MGLSSTPARCTVPQRDERKISVDQPTVCSLADESTVTRSMLKKFLHPKFPLAEFQALNFIKIIYSGGTAETRLEMGAAGEGPLSFVYLRPFKA